MHLPPCFHARLALIASLLLAALPLRAADDYQPGPDSQPQPGVPLGEVRHGTFNQSKIFPGTTRDYWVYVPNGLDPARPAPVMIFQDGLQYSATNLNTLFAQRKNLLSIPFWRMLLEILRFKRACPELYDSSDLDLTLGEYLCSRGYSGMFIEKFLLPMGAAVWSADPGQFLKFPAAAFVQFFTNHGMLNLVDQPTWRTVRGGSRQYVEPLSRPFRDRVRLSAPVAKVQRFSDRVSVVPRQGDAESFDHIIMACHSDQALALLADPSAAERELLGAIPYQENTTVLHTDSRLLPSNAKARASWNCHLPRREQGSVALTYWMNLLQSISAPVDFCVTLNSPEDIAPEKVIRRLVYHHPVYSAAAFRAQKRRDEISGVNRTSYCGAYWGWGFHEDGVNSALAVCRQFGKGL